MGFGGLGLGVRVQGSGFGVLRFRVSGLRVLGFRVQGLRFGVLSFRVLGFRV